MIKMPARPRKRPTTGALAAALALTALTVPSGGFSAVSSAKQAGSLADAWTYADVADAFLAVPVVARLRIAEAIEIKDPALAAPRAGTIRYYLVADVTTLIRGADGVPPRLAWLADVPVDARGRAPRLRRADMLVAAFRVPGRPAELRLAARDAMVAWSAALDARVRAVVASGLAPDAPPRITGVANAFHTAGTIPGEGETQIFLATASAEPVSLTVLRRPGQAPRWAVALGEIVDEAARPPARDTLGWYRLACFLPRTLPPGAVADLADADAAAARADYAFVIAALGDCTRTRG